MPTEGLFGVEHLPLNRATSTRTAIGSPFKIGAAVMGTLQAKVTGAVLKMEAGTSGEGIKTSLVDIRVVPEMEAGTSGVEITRIRLANRMVSVEEGESISRNREMH